MRISIPLSLLAIAGALLLAARPAGAAETGDQPVTLNPEVSVEGNMVTLGDLFSGLDGGRAETPVARAPEPGRQIRVTAQWLGRIAQAYRVDWQPRSLAEEITVSRASHFVGQQTITGAITGALADRGVAESTRVQLDNPTLRMELPTDVPATAEIAGLSYDAASGRFSANVVAPAAQQPEASITVTGRVVRMTEVPVLTGRKSRGDVIREDDIEWITVSADRLNRNHLTDAGRIVGKSARRAIAAGEPVRATDVEKTVLVGKNSLVTIRLETRRMQLSAKGRALEDGAKGETVRVVNTSSKATITGVVVAANLVAVQPPATPTN